MAKPLTHSVSQVIVGQLKFHRLLGALNTMPVPHMGAIIMTQSKPDHWPSICGGFLLLLVAGLGAACERTPGRTVSEPSQAPSASTQPPNVATTQDPRTVIRGPSLGEIDTRPPLVFIDGTLASDDALEALRLDQVENLQVIKVKTPNTRYGAEAANRTVIDIMLKPTGSR